MNREELEKTILEQADKVMINNISINRYVARLYASEYKYSSAAGNGEEGEPLINRRIITFDRLKENLNNRILNTQNDVEKKRSGVDFSLLPMNCRMEYKLSDTYTVYVLETPPEIRTIKVTADQHGSISQLKSSGEWDEFGYTGMDEPEKEYSKAPWVFNLAFPYCVYFIVMRPGNESKFSAFSIFFRNMPMRGLGDVLYKAPLYNIPNGQWACLGMGTPTDKDSLIMLEKLMQHFWSSEYNNDYLDNVNKYKHTPIANNYFKWQYISKTNPMEIFNIDWIPHKTVKAYMETLREEFGRRDRRDRDPRLFYSLDDFTQIFREEHIEPIRKERKDPEEPNFLVDGVSNYLKMGMHYLYCEDSFKIRNKRYFVISFMSDDQYTYEITHLKVFDENQKEKTIRLTSKIIDLICESLEKDNFVFSTTIDGVEVKKGDVIKIVTVGGATKYRKIMHMRYNLDGKLEARLGGDNYIVDKLKIIEILNLDVPKINGELIDKTKEYIVTKGQRFFHKGMLNNYYHAIYTDTDVSENGKLSHGFEVTRGDARGMDIRIPLESDDSTNQPMTASDPEKLRRMSRLYRQGVRLACYTDREGNPMDVYAGPNDYTLVPENARRSVPDVDIILNHLMFNDNSTLAIEGVDGDMCFSVGDRVITPNWSNPVEMLKYKTIKGFATEASDQYNYLNVVLENKDGSIESKKLVTRYSSSYSSSRNWIDTGAIYRVTNMYGGLRAGMKIKAKQARIANFPMKDVNIIIGILYDIGPETSPLVLCSNGCTLWYDDIIEKFDITQFEDAAWKKMEHAPLDITKIRPQAGDFYVSTFDRNSPFFICHERGSNGLKFISYQNFSESRDYGTDFRTFNADMRRRAIPYGILGPRYMQSHLMDMPRVRGFINPFLQIKENTRSVFYFPINEERVFNYVQRLPE